MKTTLHPWDRRLEARRYHRKAINALMLAGILLIITAAIAIVTIQAPHTRTILAFAIASLIVAIRAGYCFAAQRFYFTP